MKAKPSSPITKKQWHVLLTSELTRGKRNSVSEKIRKENVMLRARAQSKDKTHLLPTMFDSVQDPSLGN
jgi:hypothetical protein